MLAMGEEPWRVHTVGFPAIDLIQDGNFATPTRVAERLGLDLAQPIVLFTQHSVTTEFDRPAEQIAPSLAALERLAREGVQVIVTYPNNDAGGRRDHRGARSAGRARGMPNMQLHRSLGRRLYHGVLALARRAGASGGLRRQFVVRHQGNAGLRLPDRQHRLASARPPAGRQRDRRRL